MQLYFRNIPSKGHKNAFKKPLQLAKNLALRMLQKIYLS
jgi:hypothetical protein